GRSLTLGHASRHATFADLLGRSANWRMPLVRMREVLVLVHLQNWRSLLGKKPDGHYVIGMAIMLVADVRREAKEGGWRCALIVTALDLELQAVVAHIEPLASVKGRDGAIYECGAFHDVGQDWLIVVAESGAGTHPAQSTVTNAHIDFEPELQIFVG